MTLFVTMRIVEGKPTDVRVHLTHDSAMRARGQWLREASTEKCEIPSDRREIGTDFIVLECPVTT